MYAKAAGAACKHAQAGINIDHAVMTVGLDLLPGHAGGDFLQHMRVHPCAIILDGNKHVRIFEASIDADVKAASVAWQCVQYTVFQKWLQGEFADQRIAHILLQVYFPAQPACPAFPLQFQIGQR